MPKKSTRKSARCSGPTLTISSQAATFFPGLARLPGGRYWPITAIGAAWQKLIGSELLNQIAVEMLKASESADLRVEALGICLEKLAPYSVHMLRDRYYRDKSSAQIAAEQNCSVSAVQKTLKRVYKVLHDCIESVLSDKEAGR